MMPITARTVSILSMFDIFIHLHSINKKSYDKKGTGCTQSNSDSLQREPVRYQVTNNHKSHCKLTYIVAILGEVVYLFLIYHEDDMIAMMMPEDCG